MRNVCKLYPQQKEGGEAKAASDDEIKSNPAAKSRSEMLLITFFFIRYLLPVIMQPWEYIGAAEKGKDVVVVENNLKCIATILYLVLREELPFLPLPGIMVSQVGESLRGGGENESSGSDGGSELEGEASRANSWGNVLRQGPVEVRTYKAPNDGDTGKKEGKEGEVEDEMKRETEEKEEKEGKESHEGKEEKEEKAGEGQAAQDTRPWEKRFLVLYENALVLYTTSDAAKESVVSRSEWQCVPAAPRPTNAPCVKESLTTGEMLAFHLPPSLMQLIKA